MTTEMKTEPKVIHCLKSGFTIPRDSYGGQVVYKWQTIILSPEQVEATFDRNGKSWLDLSEEDQLSHWGEIRFGHGPAPEGMEVGDDDIHGVRYRRWLAATAYAQEISDPGERKAALAKVRADYPEQGEKSHTLSSYGGR